MNILITSCSRDVTLVQVFRAALINNGGGKVIAADMDPKAAALYFADEFVLIPRGDDKEFIPHLLNLCKEKKIDLLITARDAELLLFAREKKQFEVLGCKVLAADYDTVKICQNKLLFCRFCEENGIPIPRTFYEPDEKTIPFPAFIKPVTGAGSQKIHKVSNLKEYRLLREIYNADENFLVQEFVQWPEYTIDLFAGFDGEVISVIPRERIRTVGGESYIGKTVKIPPIIDESVRLAKKLGLIGHNTLQCFCNGKEVKFIEVNPRYGGGANLGFHSGANTPQLLVRMLRGEKIEPRIGEFRENVVMLRYTRDIFLEEDTSVPGRKTFKIMHEADGEENQIYCIDVDGTICTEGVEYEKVLPIEKTIKKINELYDRGHTIILYSARGAYSGYDWSPLTEKMLKSWGVKYHQFMLGKPFAHWYIDNKAIHILDWI